MKIGFVLDDGLDKPDGVQQYILTLGTFYQQHGHEVRYLVGQTTRTDIDNVYSLARNVRVTFNGNSLTVPLLTSKKRIRAVLAAEQFDVLHVQMPYSPFFGARVVAAAPKSTAVIGTFHILPYGWLSSVGTHLLGIALKPSLRRFNAFVSVSKPAAEFACKTFKINSDVVPNMVDLSEFTPRKPIHRKKGLSILFLGRLVQRKGCAQLLEALALLHESNRLPADCIVTICGTGPLRSHLEQFVLSHGLADHVTFAGFVSHEDKIAYMQQADIAAFPSLSGESFGIVLIEAMAAQSTVVLGGDNPGYTSVLADVPGSIVSAHEPHVFADQLYTFISDPAKRAQLHSRQQAHVQQFDGAIVSSALLKLYQSCKSSHNT